MNKQNLIIIGPFEWGKDATNGVSVKNRFFKERFTIFFKKIITIDSSFVEKKHPFKTILFFLKLFFYGIFYKTTKIVVSENIVFAYRFVLKYLFFIRKNGSVYYWAPGGTLPKLIKDNHYNIKYYTSLRKIYVQGQKLVDELNSMGIFNAVFVPNSKYIPRLPVKKHREDNIIKFVFVSRVHPSKGINEIARCAKYLDDNGYKDRYKIDFYGKIEPGYDAEFEEAIRESPNMHYMGFIDLRNFDNYEKLVAYDVALFPTYWHGEGFPGVVIDAYIAGLPVIATDWNLNSAYILNGETGVIIPVHDELALRDAMLSFLDGKQDLRQMSQNCQREVLQYDNRKVLSEDNLRVWGFLDA